MPLQLTGTVTRRSNGSIDIVPTGDAAASRVVLHESPLGSKALPAMGDEVTITIEIATSVDAIEAAQAPAPESAAEAVATRKKK